MTLQKVERNSLPSGLDCPRVAESDVVPFPAGESDRHTTPASPASRSSAGPIWEPSPTDSTRSYANGCLADLRSQWEDKQLSEQALQLISASWRPSTEKAYSSAWRRWIGWCSTKQTDTFPTTVTPVIEFLVAEFQDGKQYATLNTYRSALSATIPQIERPHSGATPLSLPTHAGHV